jgi:hypothetical protein
LVFKYFMFKITSQVLKILATSNYLRKILNLNRLDFIVKNFDFTDEGM